MKHTTSRLFLLLMAWLSVGAYAQTNRLYIPDVKMSRGGEAVLSVFMDNVDNVTAVEFTIEMPEGFTINPVSAILSERAKSHQMTARVLKNGKYKFVVMSQTNSFISGIAGKLFTVRVSAPEGATDEGEYPLTITGAVMSAKSGQNLLQEVDGGKIIIKSMPNLHVISLESSEPVAGQPVTVKWKVRNDGRGTTGDNSWKDYIWLVPNIAAGTSMTGSKMLKSVDNVSALAPGESYENTANVTLDERIYGNYDLVVTSNMYGANDIDFSNAGGEAPRPYDPDNADYGFLMAKGNASYITIEEENEYNGESDNFFYKRIDIQVPPLADIQVPSVVAVVDNSEDVAIGYNRIYYTGGGNFNVLAGHQISGLASSSAFYSGKKVLVTATIKNDGGADISETYIKNVMYISSSPDMQSGQAIVLATNDLRLSLKAGESTQVSFSGYIPAEWYGNTYFVVRADVDDAVYELANTANNSGATVLINTLLSPGADFEPYNLSLSDHISSGKAFDISYAVRNVGPGVPFSNSWKDKIYISSKNTGLDSSAKQIGEFSQTGSYKLAEGVFEYQGDNYKAARSVSVTDLPPGTYYIYLMVDGDNDVFEYDGENNNVIISKAVQLANPDLTVELVSVSEETMSTNTKVSVSWRLKNIGTADIQNATVTDGFYAGSSANDANAISIGTVTNTVSIVAGGEKVLRTNLTIPKNSSLNGTRQFFVKTNIDNKVKEASAANNASAAVTKQFVYAESSVEEIVSGTNLIVTALQVASSVNPGESIPISYTVKNNGTLGISKEVKQEIFISKSNNFDTSAKALTVTGSLPSLAGLQPNAAVMANVSVTIPANIKGGQNYVYVIINKDNTIAEVNSDDNLDKSPVYINENLPNFTVSNMVVPATMMTSKKTEISWTLKNTGTWDASDINCTVYLSSDATFSNEDKQMAVVRSGKLAKNSSVNMKADIEIADDVVGTRYLIVKANTSNIEELTTEDNTLSQSFTAVLSPLPDLTISDLSTEGSLKAGQSVTMKAKVSNVGDDETHSDKWNDVFYLSEEYTLDVNKAIKLGSRNHVGKIAKDGSYQISTDLIVPESAKGYYVLFASTDETSALKEKSKENNQTFMTVYVEDPNDTPADLVVTNVSAPSRIMAGEAINISYNIANQGEYVAKGKLRDVIYMSKDSKWDESDTMVGVVTGDVDIDAGTEITRSVTGRISNVKEGNYYLIIRTNSTHAIVETDYDNNQAIGRSSSTLAFHTLNIDGSTTVRTSGLFKLPMHSGLVGKTVGLYLSTPENTSAGLYSAFERVPSTAKYDRSATNLELTEQEVLIPNVQEGNYYILAQDNAAISRSLNEFVIKGEQDLPETVMTLSAREVQFGATTLSIKEGGTDGWISMDIRGALLDSIMDFRLSSEDHIIPAESITFYDQTSTKASFNLHDAKVGSYDVISELPNGTLATMPDGFKVVPGTNVALGVKLEAPRVVHYGSYAPLSIAYANGGNTDIAIYELLLVIDHGYLATTMEGLKEGKSELHIKIDGGLDNRGMVIIPPGKQGVITCYMEQRAGTSHLKLYIVK